MFKEEKTVGQLAASGTGLRRRVGKEVAQDLANGARRATDLLVRDLGQLDNVFGNGNERLGEAIPWGLRLAIDEVL